MNIIGFKLDDLVRKQVTDADVLLADVTYPNHNVFYELGCPSRSTGDMG
jgi:hypothetical protein